MKIPVRLTIVLTAGVVFAACFEDRGVLIVPDGTAGAPGGGAGATGTTGNAGATGSTGGVGPGCDAMPIFMTHNCSLAGACHDRTGSAAGLDLNSPGWELRLVGGIPGQAGNRGAVSPSMCADQGRVYLVPGSQPATGLFLQKLFMKSPPCGMQMPNLPPLLDATELACVQSWANALTARSP